MYIQTVQKITTQSQKLEKKIYTQLTTKKKLTMLIAHSLENNYSKNNYTQSYKIEKYPTSYEISQSQFRKKSIQFRKKKNNYATNYEKLDVYTMLIAYCLENNYSKNNYTQSYKNTIYFRKKRKRK